ncbi:MAG TPA: twin-arginine translocase TatA/TatE family subunit [Bacteroidales bacterium]|nr:twin-arginine translocase TatA/TatE family subunit [Bacteroidales bacterium]
MTATHLLFLGRLGPLEIILIFAVVLLLFGGRKLPELFKGLGKGIRNFKEGMSGATNDEKEEEKNKETKQ